MKQILFAKVSKKKNRKSRWKTNEEKSFNGVDDAKKENN